MTTRCYSIVKAFNAASLYFCLIISIIAGKNEVVSFVLDAAAVKPSSSLSNPEETGRYFQGDIIWSASMFSGRVDPKFRWNNRTIPYEFDTEYPPNLRDTFLRAVNHIEARTCLKFHPRQAVSSSLTPPSDYLLVTSVFTGCFSYVGRQGGRQNLSLPPPCHNLGTFVHELLHAIGFHHEQSRTDRDDYVSIVFENVQAGKESNFRKYDAATVSSFDVPYDYASVMHYSRFAFSKSRQLETIVPMMQGVEIGQRYGMSVRDEEKVNKMYNCQ